MKHIPKCLVIILFFSWLHVKSQSGNTLIRNYSPKEYNATGQNWAIVQDERDVLYFGNGKGVLEYDGSEWRIYPNTNNSTVRSMAFDSSGRLFVGGVGEIGYLDTDSTGNLFYTSLLKKLPPEYQKFADVWQTLGANNELFFRTTELLFRWKNNEFKVWAAEFPFFTANIVKNMLFIQQRVKGLLVLANDSLQTIPGGEIFGSEPIYDLFSYKEHNVLIGTRKKGLHMLNSNDLKFNDKGILNQSSQNLFSKFNTSGDKFLANNLLYCGTELADGSFAFGTLRNGVIIFDSTGNTLEVINKKSGLLDEKIWCIKNDNQGNLWIAHNYGLSKLEINSPVTFFNEKNDLRGSVHDLIEHQGMLYVATAQGIFYVDSSNIVKGSGNNLIKFKNIPDILEICWSLLPFKEDILAASSDGLYIIKNLVVERLIHFGSRVVIRSQINPSRIYIGHSDGVLSMRYKKNKWINEGEIFRWNDEIRSIVEDSAGNLWMGTKYSGVLNIKFMDGRNLAGNDVTPLDLSPQFSNYDTSYGIPDGEMWAYQLNGEAVFLSNDGSLFQFEEKPNSESDTTTGKFEKYDFSNLKFDLDLQNIRFVSIDKAGNILLKLQDKLKFGIRQPDNSYRWVKDPFMTSEIDGLEGIYLDHNNMLWIGTDQNLYKFSLKYNRKFNNNYKTLIRKVTTNNDSVIFYGTSVEQYNSERKKSANFMPYLNYHQNSIQFNYSSPFFLRENKNEYSYCLEGFDENWSKWTNDTKANYTNLTEGNYSFKVKAKNILENISQEASYQFTILPPWYRTIWAYCSYVLLLIALMYSILLLSNRRMREAKIRLEKIVEDRTKEIVAQNIQLEAQQGEIRRKTKNITESINYAQRIQETIMPTTETLANLFPESFIYFKAKDVVSGDFPWIAEVGDDVFVSVVDCTGHGVPGAMMSMIGYFLLNDIVLSRNIRKTGLILEELHKGVHKTLQQDKNFESRDGMDLAFCKINRKTMEIQFSGAHRQLQFYHMHDGKPMEIKGDRLPIGGTQYSRRGKEIKFTTHQLTVKKGDAIYFYSDGLPDQLGGAGARPKSFGNKQIMKIITDNLAKPMVEMPDIFDAKFEEWKSKEKQLDDLLMIGIRFS